MSGTAHERSVYRYFDLADCFVQIVALEEGSLSLAERPGLGRAGYRKLVIEACMPEFRGRLEDRLERLFPDDPLMVEDLLYQLCVEVNPSLDIHEVRLTVESDGLAAGAPATELERRPEDGGARDDLLDRLAGRAMGLEAALRRNVIGQDAAVASVVRAVRSAAAGLGESHKPLASFLFTGRTGTGKTELARRLGEHLFPESKEGRGVVRIDCSEYALAHEYSKLIGAPPGYVGHDDGGQLTDRVAENPETIVLFDEVEKAHPKLHQLMLQILEEGVLTDGKGKRIPFDRTIVVMTSNCGAEDVERAGSTIGFDGQSASLSRGSLLDLTNAALSRSFPPEFLGRIGDTVLFDELDEPAVERIAAKKLRELAERAGARSLQIRFTPAVAKWVARRGFRPECGARELGRVLRREIEPRLSEILLEGRASRGTSKVVVRARRDVLSFDVA